MPSRWIILGIVLFWAGTTSWLIYREIMPDFLSREPILYNVEAADEYRSHQGMVPKVLWNIKRNEKVRYILKTSAQYEENDDLFEIYGSMVPLLQSDQNASTEKGSAKSEEGELTLNEFGVRVRKIVMRNHYWVTRTGTLVAFNLDTQYDLSLPQSDLAPVNLFVNLQGEPRNGSFAPVVMEHALVKDKEEDPNNKSEVELDSLAVSDRGCVLNPLHPVHRLRDVRPGQTWNCLAVSPFCLLERPPIGPGYADILPLQKLSTDAPRVLRSLQLLTVRTGAEQEILDWEHMPRPEDSGRELRKLSVPCFVLTFGNEDSQFWFRTWVHAAEGWVLKQEAHLWGETWTIMRMTPLP